ncbi:MAG: serine/threonine-protein kinase [Myxococcota bacterium]
MASTEYTFVRELQRGGMGTVELVLRADGRFERLFARKRILRSLRDDPRAAAMFREESRIAGLLRHQNVVAVLDVGEDSEGPFMVMEYVDGLSLASLIKGTGGELLPLQAVVRILLDVARGLRAAHEARDPSGASLDLIHRDITPQNVLIGWDGAVKLTDFGIVKAVGRETETTVGILKGKPGYMSPEQLTLRPVDHRSDLFSLGVVLYEALAGRRLYRGDDAQRAHRIVYEAPPDLADIRPDVPPRLVQLAFDLLAKDCRLRPQQTAEVVERLEEILDDLIEDEGSTSLEHVLERYFGPLKADREQELRRLLRLTRTRISRARRTRIAAQVVGVALVLSAAGLYAAWTPEPGPPETPKPSHAANDTRDAAVAEPAEEASPVPEPAPPTPVVEPTMRRTRRGRAMRRAPATPAPQTPAPPTPAPPRAGPLHQWQLDE